MGPRALYWSLWPFCNWFWWALQQSVWHGLSQLQGNIVGELLDLSYMERFALILLQVPHGFQQALSVEKTLTLSYAIPSFHAMRMYWTAQKETMPHVSIVIDAGLEKLAQYVASMSVVPAYFLVTGTLYLSVHVSN